MCKILDMFITHNDVLCLVCDWNDGLTPSIELMSEWWTHEALA